MEPDDLLCSRNARPQKALALANGTSRRASGWAGEKVACRGRSISPHPWRDSEQAWKERVYRWTRAVEVVSATLFRGGIEKLEGVLLTAIVQWLLRCAMMSLASATGSVAKGAVC
jgi:hypothetical protein